VIFCNWYFQQKYAHIIPMASVFPSQRFLLSSDFNFKIHPIKQEHFRCLWYSFEQNFHIWINIETHRKPGLSQG
jgi:hypothetical protein